MKHIYLAVGILFLSCYNMPLHAQGMTAPSNEDQNIDAYVSLLRQDIQSQAVAIIGQMMQFTPEQASAFWPVYSEYARELQRIGDIRVTNIKDYAVHFSNITDQKAEELMDRSFEFQVSRLNLKRQYFDKFSKAISPKLAAKFFQVENQLQLIIDLQVSASLPIVE